MKKIDFTQIGGFPMAQETLAFMQQATNEVLKALIGHFNIPNVGSYIISGCENDGTTIAPGIMYIDGDLCFFAGALAGAGLDTPIGKALITVDAPFESGTNYPVYTDYVAQIDGDIKYSTFVRVPQVKELEWANIINKPTFVVDPHTPPFTPANKSVLQRLEELEAKNSVFKAGWGMILWNKPANLIPVGWAEVENFRGKIPVGMNISVDGSGNAEDAEFRPNNNQYDDTGTPGRTGGSKTQILTTANLPPIPVHFRGSGDDTDSTDGPLVNTNNKEENSGITVTVGGNSTAFSILNPFRTVLFIEWVGL